MPEKNFAIWWLWLCVVSVLCFGVYGCPISGHLNWAPGIRKSVYTSFLNDFSCPTWTTRNSFTKKPTYRSDRTIPIGSPFAFMCGACFTSYSGYKVNFTLDSNDMKVDFRPLNSKPGNPFHRGIGGDDCLVSLGLTAPVTKGGSLTCHLNRGKKRFSESITFSAAYVPVIEEDMETVHSSDGIAELACPQVDILTNDIVYVWHSPLEDNPSPKIIVPSMRANVTIPVTSSNLKVTCTTYDSRSPTQVRQKSFLIKGKMKPVENSKPTEELLVGNASYQEEEPESMSFTLIAIIVGSVIGGFVAIAVGVSVCAAMRRSCRDSKPKAVPRPGSNGHVPLMTEQRNFHKVDSMLNRHYSSP